MIDFHQLRHDPAHHLGLGDVRITISQQQEIEQVVTDLLAALEEIADYRGSEADRGGKAEYEIQEIARAVIAKARPQAGSPYLNKPLRSFEQAVRDSEGN